jgi:DNA-binding GntR family transcriptional regulator
MNEMDEGSGPTRTDRIAAAIADAIAAGEFLPGARLDEQALAGRYGVSRTPIREALRQLGTTGLVEVRPRRGAVVAALNAAQLSELFVAMGEIEATCARLAAQSMSPIERRRLAALHDAMGGLARAGDAAGYARANVGFHGAIYAGAHNGVLAEFAAGLRRRVQSYRQAQFQVVGRLPRSHAEHGAVVAAVVAGRPDEAHAAMLHHVNLVETTVEDLIESLPGARAAS